MSSTVNSDSLLATGSFIGRVQFDGAESAMQQRHCRRYISNSKRLVQRSKLGCRCAQPGTPQHKDLHPGVIPVGAIRANNSSCKLPCCDINY